MKRASNLLGAGISQLFKKAYRLPSPIIVSCCAMLGLGLTTIPSTALAQSQTEFCAEGSAGTPLFPCLNAWGGGPEVQTETPGTSNEDFTIQVVDKGGVGYREIEYLPTGSCVGDIGNSSSDARAGMDDPCGNPNTGAGAGWGTLFTLQQSYCGQGYVWSNVHWGGFLNYSNYPQQSDDLAYYLNSGEPGYCMGSF